ncbi:MAG: hypothetical protein FJX51_12290, partial [Alphaproteobacteria bacterium]|nr:hypothetical protein [Alphaproteobacteria bacterium]
MLRRPFTAHPESVGESYVQHLAFAASVGARMIVAGVACMIHGILPFLFVRTGSRTIVALYGRIAWGPRRRVAEEHVG